MSVCDQDDALVRAMQAFQEILDVGTDLDQVLDLPLERGDVQFQLL